MSPPRMPRTLRLVAAGAILVVLVGFGWLLTAGRFDLLERQHRAADFYDAQAHSFLDGRWSIEPGVLGIEAFEIGDEEHTYFGVLPALLRLPVAAVTERFDGRLTQLSMLGALALALAAVSSLNWSVRSLVRADPAIERRDRVLAAVVPLTVGLGTVLLYLGGQAWVYHEAILWGVAWVLTSLAALLRYLRGGHLPSLVVAAGAALAALHSRASVGAGPLVALGLVAVLVAADHPWVRRARARLAPALRADRRALGVALGTLVIALGSYVAVNLARFGEPLRLPLERQTYALTSDERQAVLAANDGTLFGLQFVPTTLVHYGRPDAIDLGRVFPFVGFPEGVRVIGGARFDTLDPTAGVPATMPGLVAAGLAGVVAVGSALRLARPLGVVAIPLVGAAVGVLTILAFGYVAERYKADAVPFLVLAALPGLHLSVERSGRPAAVARAVVAALAAWGVVANASLGLLYQRQVAPSVEEDLRAGLVGMQLDAADLVPGATLPPIARGAVLPASAGDGVLFVLGGCDGLYWGDGDAWRGVERTRATGRWTLDVTWPDVEPGAVRPLLSSGGGHGANVLVAVDQPDGRVRVGYVWDDPDGRRSTHLGRAVEVARGERQRLDVVSDPNNVEIRVELGGRLVYEGYRFEPRPGDVVGTSEAGGEVDPRFSGRIRAVEAREADLCRRVVEAATGRG